MRLLRGILWRIVSDPNRLGLKEDIIIAWTAKFIMWFWQRMSQPKKHHYMPHWQTGEVCRLFVVHTRKYHQKAFVLFTVLYTHKYHQKAFVLF